jgi:hypothetical protein
MKGLIIATMSMLMCGIILGQDTTRIVSVTKLSCSQKYGLDIYEGEYVLSIVLRPDSLQFNTRKSQEMTKYAITKKTDSYIVANSSGNYCFYNIKKQQLYYIDYFFSRYTTAGYGSGYSEIKQNVLQMMELLKGGATQKDVIKHLIDQAAYDF